MTREQVWNGESATSAAFISTLWWSRMFAGTLLTCALIAVLYFAAPHLFPNIPLLLLATAVGTGNWRAGLTVTEFGLIGERRALAYRLLTFSVFVTSISLIILLVVVYEMGIWGAVLGEFIALGIWLVLTGFRHTWLSLPKFRKLDWRSFTAFSIPIVPHIVFMWGLVSADRLILSSLVDKELIGVYDIAYLLGSGIAVFGTALLLPWLPTFYKHTDKLAAAEYFKKRALSQTVICLAIALTANLFAFEICSVMASTYSHEATPLMQLILPATLLLMLNAIYIKPLIHLKKTTTISCLSGAGFAANILLNFLLVPKLGVVGSAVATIAAYALMTITCLIFSNRHLGLIWNLKNSAVTRVLVVAVLVFVAGIFLPLRITPMTMGFKIILTIFCWLALYLRVYRHSENGQFGVELCLSPLQS